MELHELLERVVDQKSFLAFARTLATDRANSAAKEVKAPSSPYAAASGGWENTTIESFLEAALSWAEASNFGVAQGLSEQNPWKQFAAFLYCGKIYE